MNEVNGATFAMFKVEICVGKVKFEVVESVVLLTTI